MRLKLDKLKRLTLSLTLAAAGLLPACAQIGPSSHTGAPPAPTQVVAPKMVPQPRLVITSNPNNIFFVHRM